ncbi:MAG: hypothetical protein OXI77_05090 [Chloroflexota bacterium]|nr:hypothetical protein [Chloroflexota bacterium]MDE2910423.1 hypothetical protein [Chloroflexota bacterium]
MDISTASGALVISILRLLHIVFGLIWVGAAFLLSFYIEPAARASGSDGDRFLRALYRRTNFPRLIPLSALITTIAGLLLYGLLSYHDAMSSAMGLILSIGALFGLLAFGHGYFTVWRRAGEVAARASEDASADGTAGQLEAKMRRNGRVSLWLALISMVLMAGARYAGPIFA